MLEKTPQGKRVYKKGGKSVFKRFIGFVHLWLGLISGVLIVFLGITGCILTFEVEIRSVTESYRFVEKQDKPFISPSVILAIASKSMDKYPKGIEFRGPQDAVVAAYYDEDSYLLAFLNPYTGKVLKKKDMGNDFFRVITAGHYNLWLPENIGKPIVASATIVFVVMLISGIILWWPKNKPARKQRFSFRWNVSFKRLNYDLHNVLGFYASWVAIFIAVTGLVFGFEWFSRSLYYATSGGKTIPEHKHPVSDTLLAKNALSNPVDQVYYQLRREAKPGEAVSVYLPSGPADALEGAINHWPGTYFNTDYYHYDQYSLQELPATGVYSGTFANAAIADKIQRMNYDIHVGAVLGLPGKILAFSASLICASLPITGFLIWLGRRKKNSRSKAG